MDYNKKTSKNFSALAYKILNDILVFSLIAFSLFLLAENALPGIISNHLSLLKLILIIFAILELIVFLGRKNDFQFSASDKKNPPIRRIGLTTNKRTWKIFLTALTIFFLILIANSLFRFSLWEILIITPLSCFVLIYFYKILFIP